MKKMRLISKKREKITPVLTQNQREYMTDNSVIGALPKLIINIDMEEIKRSRMESYLDRVLKHCQHAVLTLPPLSKKEFYIAFERLLKFFSVVKWTETNRVDIRVLVSFLFGLINESQTKYSQLIVDALSDMYEWINRDEQDSNYIIVAENALKIWREQREEFYSKKEAKAA